MSAQERYKWVGQRRRICMYRFHKMVETRKKYFYQNLLKEGATPQFDIAKKQILGIADHYFNCLRNQYNQEIPEKFTPKQLKILDRIHKFKKMLYEELKPACDLQDLTVQILNDFYRG